MTGLALCEEKVQESVPGSLRVPQWGRWRVLHFYLSQSVQICRPRSRQKAPQASLCLEKTKLKTVEPHMPAI